MNNNINIAEILKDYPKGTKLYSPLFGDVTLEEVDSTWAATVKIKYKPNSFTNFFKTGLYYNYEGAECLLFPSSEMRDWSKFFKRGDLVCRDDGIYAIFDDWVDNNYTKFKTTIDYSTFKQAYSTNAICDTKYFVKVTHTQKMGFITCVERYFKGKYNPNTLQVDSIKFKCEFKPFDKVLVRDRSNQKWKVDMFSYYSQEEDNFPYQCISNCFRYCIPYTEQTAHLVGTTDNK